MKSKASDTIKTFQEKLAERTQLLNTLLRLDTSLHQTISELNTNHHDFLDDEPLALLSREQVTSILDRFIHGDITGEDLYAWADALELRDDVQFGKENDGGEVFDIVSDISTTYVLRGPITKAEAQLYISELEKRPRENDTDEET